MYTAPSNNFQTSSNEPWQLNTNSNPYNPYSTDQSPHSPQTQTQTRPFNLPISSFKSFPSNNGTPTSQKYLIPPNNQALGVQSLQGQPLLTNNNNNNNNTEQLITGKLTPLIQSEKNLGNKVTSKIVTLVSSNDGNSLHFPDQAANILQRYPNNQIVFVGIWGSVNSDKSFFFDKILNLCDVQGDKYFQASTANNNNNSSSCSQLYFYQRPFLKQNIKFFLVQAKGYKNAQQLSKMQKNQLDILISICQVIILIQDNINNNSNNVDIVQIGYRHFNDSFRRLYVDSDKNNRNKSKGKKKQADKQVQNGKQQQLSQICWPNSLFILYNTPASIKKHKNSQQNQQQLTKMFKDYSFSILHPKTQNSSPQLKTYTTITNPLPQLYLKNTQIIFLQIYSKITAKTYQNIRYTGLTMPHILAQSIYTLNQHKYLYMPRAINKSKKSIYSSMYNRYALAYLLKMKEFIGEEKPYSTDYLLDAFKSVNQETMEEYYQTQRDIAVMGGQDSLCLEYQKKLESYIEEKERNILAVNSKKSAKQLNNILAQTANPLQQLKKVQYSIIDQNKRSFDNNAETIFVGNSIKSLLTKGNGGSPLGNMVGQNVTYTNNQNPPNSMQGQTVTYQTQGQPQIDQYTRQPYPQSYQQPQTVQYRYKEQLQQKQQLLLTKRAQLQKLQKLQQNRKQQQNNQLNKYKKQQKQLLQQILREEQQISQLRSQVKNSQLMLAQGHQGNQGQQGSGLASGGGSDQMFILNQAKVQLQELRKKYQQQQNQKSTLLLQQQKGINDPQIQFLKSKLMAKKGELQKQQVRVSKISNGNGVRVSNDGLGAQRRVIDARTANIRRVHGSKI